MTNAARVRVTLGRDGECAEDFDAWVDCVVDNIHELCGFYVDVEVAHSHDIQSDIIIGASEEDRQTVNEAMHSLWDSFCSEVTP